MSSAPLPPPRRQAYRANHATPPRTPPTKDKPFPAPLGPRPPPGGGTGSAGSSATASAEARPSVNANTSVGTSGSASGANHIDTSGGIATNSTVAVDSLSATEMEDHLAAFESLGPPGALRRPTRRVRSIERTWTWVKSRSSVYGEASLMNGSDNVEDEDDHRDAPTGALGISSRPLTVATTGNVNLADSPPRRNSTTGMDPDERRRRRQGILPDSVNGLGPPPRPLPRIPTRASPVQAPSSTAAATSEKRGPSPLPGQTPDLPRTLASGPSAERATRESSSSRAGLDLSRDHRDHRDRPRPLPIFPPGPDTDSPPQTAVISPTANSSSPKVTTAGTQTISGERTNQSPTGRATLSIHDIVNRHSSAVAQATEDVKDRARAELALRPDLLATARTRKKSMAATSQNHKRGMPPPALPKIEPTLKLEPAPDSPDSAYSSSLTPPASIPSPALPPGAAPPALPLPAKSTHRRRQSSRSTTISTDTSDSYVNEIRFAQAAYNHLAPKPPATPTPAVSAPAPPQTLTPPPASAVNPHTRAILSPTPEHSPRSKARSRDRDRDRSQTQSPDVDGRKGSNGSLKRSKSSSPLLPEDDSHAIALYLRSPQLNRNLLIARPYPERPLQVSVADLGKPDGRPVVVFLGLGCVRYLIALYDDLARALGLRLICIDRWGLGKTDQIPQNQRGLLDWADVVRRVLDELGVERFQVLAHSAGAPYALATVLKMERRVHGKIHLLAPWVGGDVEGETNVWKPKLTSGYRWLKWVPNSVIKSALAAEWRLESYFLGKAPTIKHTIRSKSEAMLSSTSLDSDETKSRASFGQEGTLRPDSRLGAVEVDGFDTLASDLYPAPTGWTTTPPSVSVTSVSSSPGFTQALMQASHAESLSGTTADLLSVVLGRDAKPWGFSYTDIRHPCKIWYGADDERVSEKSMRWMERAMDAELHVVAGEGHNLMSSRVVMFDVLDSLAEDIF